MKKINIYTTLTNLILDFFIIIGAFFLAREIRLVTDLIPNVSLPIQTINTDKLLEFSILGAFVLIVIFLVHGLYRFDSSLGRVKEYSKIFIYSFYSFVFFTVIVHLGKDFIFNTEIPRLIILYTYLFGSFFLIFERFLVNVIKEYFYKKGLINKVKLFIINNKSGKRSQELLDSFIQSDEYNIVGILGKKNKDDFSIGDLERLIKSREIDELLYVSSKYKNDEIEKLWDLTRIFGVKYRYLANSFDLAKSNTEMSLVNGLPALELNSTTLSGWNSVSKRLFDIAVGIILTIIFIPVFIIISILIKLEDPSGPIIFKNKRVGRDGKEFDLYKFRYMKWKYCTKDSYNVSKKEREKALEFEQSLISKSSSRTGPLYKIKNDPRKTRVGTFIEKYSIDELPQFFNVIKGNMSLVGPRPHQPREVEKYDLEHKMLLTIKPGVTGMAQVNGRETNTFEDEAKLDIYYIENWSILLDIKILFKTIFVVLTRK